MKERKLRAVKHWSYSAYGVWKSCAFKFYCERMLGMRGPPVPAMQRGTAIHALQENLLKGKIYGMPRELAKFGTELTALKHAKPIVEEFWGVDENWVFQEKRSWCVMKMDAALPPTKKNDYELYVQDLKTGHLVHATPAIQQVGQYLGAATACWAVAATLLFLGNEFGFGSAELPAPQATLMKTVIEGQLDGSLPWGLVLAGAGLAAGAMVAGLQGLAFAIGVYLPLGSMMPIFIGGLARRLADSGRPPSGPDAAGHNSATAGILGASGLVAGEGLAGVVVAGLFGGAIVGKPTGSIIEGTAGQLVGALVIAAVVAFLVRASRARA